jgi:SAM-dependent methyltransferase
MALLHDGLPREGPGDDRSTADALRRLPRLPHAPVVLDLGCGPGRQTLVLAKLLGTKVNAVDIHRPFLGQLERSAEAQGLSHLIETRLQDMGALDVPPDSVDLIWSEGAAYILGFEEALRRWRPLLKPRGLMALTECTWLTDDPPDEARDFWHNGYPAMGTITQNCRRADVHGFDVLDTFALPGSAWWDDYYTPLQSRVQQLRPTTSTELIQLLDETEREIDLFRHHGSSYGYVFFLLRRRPGPPADGRSPLVFCDDASMDRPLTLDDAG